MKLLRLHDEVPDWWSQARCWGMGGNAMVIRRGDSGAVQRERCLGCPVALECFIEGAGEPSAERVVGPMRAGLNGRQWVEAHRTLRVRQPESMGDWAALLALVWLQFGFEVSDSDEGLRRRSVGAD